MQGGYLGPVGHGNAVTESLAFGINNDDYGLSLSGSMVSENYYSGSFSYQISFLNLALESRSLQFGEYTLKSGRSSPYFFNAANMLSNCSLYELGKCYVDAINDKGLKFDCIYGPAYKGIFLGSIVATLLSEKDDIYPLSFNRKEEK